MITTIRRSVMRLLLAGIAAWATSAAVPSRSFAAEPSARPEGPATDSKQTNGRDSAAARSRTSGDRTSPTKTDQARTRNGGRPPVTSTDEQLLKELDAGDETAPPKRDAAPAEELGRDADPLTRIGTKMRAAETLIKRQKLSPRTIRLQQDIVQDIDALIKKLRKQMQQQSSLAQSKPRGTSVREKVVPPGRSPHSRPEGQESKSASASENRTHRPPPPAPVDAVPIAELMKRFWADLPEKDREQMRQAAEPEFLPKYRTEIQKYFRRLADGDNSQP